MTLQLRKAERQKAKLRIGLGGSSGSGKTYSALLMASGMTSWDKIALIDTENGSGELYSDLGGYNVITITDDFAPERYIEAIKMCEKAGMEVIIIDSVTHEWSGKGGCLEVHGKMPGNSFTNWAKITPRHNAFIDAIVQSPCHIITTVRKKQDYMMSQDGSGKAQVTKLGLADIQRDGYSYELTVNFDIDIAHFATADKDRTGLFMDKPPFVITSSTGNVLKEWAESGKDVVFTPETIKEDAVRDLFDLLKKKGAEDAEGATVLMNAILSTKIPDIMSMTQEQAKNAIKKLTF
jgi:hypothetical protein